MRSIVSTAVSYRRVLAGVRACVASLAGRDVGADEPLLDAGLDSLTAVVSLRAKCGLTVSLYSVSLYSVQPRCMG